MILWILIVKIMLMGPLGIPRPMPYLAFEKQSQCDEAGNALPSNTKWDCVAFATDKVEPEE